MKLTVFLLLEATPAWLALSREERSQIADPAMADAFARPGLSCRYFDAEAFHARISDVAMIEADSPQDYYFAIERLRDSDLIARGYFRMVDIVPAYEDGFRAYEAASDAA